VFCHVNDQSCSLAGSGSPGCSESRWGRPAVSRKVCGVSARQGVCGEMSTAWFDGLRQIISWFREPRVPRMEVGATCGSVCVCVCVCVRMGGGKQ
jgi:hypothetical protein